MILVCNDNDREVGWESYKGSSQPNLRYIAKMATLKLVFSSQLIYQWQFHETWTWPGWKQQLEVIDWHFSDLSWSSSRCISDPANRWVWVLWNCLETGSVLLDWFAKDIQARDVGCCSSMLGISMEYHEEMYQWILPRKRTSRLLEWSFEPYSSYKSWGIHQEKRQDGTGGISQIV